MEENKYHTIQPEEHHCSQMPDTTELITQAPQSQKIKVYPPILQLFQKQRNVFYFKYRCSI
jgi:hypothetical protein